MMEGKTTKEHKKHEPVHADAAVITLSDTRTLAEDDSGNLITKLLEGEGHRVVHHVVIKDSKEALAEEIQGVMARGGVRIIITDGGTGIGSRDITIETVRPFLEKEISAFSSLFTLLSYGDIGTAALVSRAFAGTFDGRAIFCLPGSPKAVELAMQKLILPELQHVLHHMSEGKRGEMKA